MDGATERLSSDVTQKDASDAKRPSQDVGQYLRDAYRGALDEGVPDDMMDLLRKLD